MSGRRDSRESLKKRFERALESIWKIPGDPLPEEPLLESPRAPLTKDQSDSTKDPLDLLIEKENSQD